MSWMTSVVRLNFTALHPSDIAWISAWGWWCVKFKLHLLSEEHHNDSPGTRKVVLIQQVHFLHGSLPSQIWCRVVPAHWATDWETSPSVPHSGGESDGSYGEGQWSTEICQDGRLPASVQWTSLVSTYAWNCHGVLHVGRRDGHSVMVKCVRLFQPLNESELLPPQPLQELQSSMEYFKQKRKFREGEEEEEGHR